MKKWMWHKLEVGEVEVVSPGKTLARLAKRLPWADYRQQVNVSELYDTREAALEAMDKWVQVKAQKLRKEAAYIEEQFQALKEAK